MVRTPPFRGFLGTSSWKETHNALEGSDIPPCQEMPWDLQRGALLACCRNGDLGLNKWQKNGRIDLKVVRGTVIKE